LHYCRPTWLLGVCFEQRRTWMGLLLSFGGAWFLAARALVPIQQAFQHQQQFVADASHELRTPLAILHSSADLLVREPEQPNPELVLEMREEIVRIERLTRDLLVLARSDRGELRLSVGRLDLGALAHDLARRVALLAQARAVNVEVTATKTPVIVEGDPDRLQEVGLSLLDNALRHTPAGGTIGLTVDEDDGAGRLVVEDTGEGIPAGRTALDRPDECTAQRSDRRLHPWTSGTAAGDRVCGRLHQCQQAPHRQFARAHLQSGRARVIAQRAALWRGQSWWGALGDAPGPFALVLIACGVFLVDRLNKFPLVLAFLAAYFAAFAGASIVAPGAVAEMFRSPFVQAALFVAFFMLTDPPTSPNLLGDQVVYGLAAALWRL
jgi:His Kinase A (phospho-acceptor) domain/Histidine kinase-, DNA gyrase B-, and HSP90-like ATPase